MTHTFLVGETYQTRDGHEAHLLKWVGQSLIGYIWLEGCPLPHRWNSDGAGMGKFEPYDLMPPKRQVWVAVWRDRGCATVQTFACDNECHAERVASKDIRTRIAVLGPIDVEAEP